MPSKGRTSEDQQRSADEAEKKIKARYPNLALDVIAHFGAMAQFAGKR